MESRTFLDRADAGRRLADRVARLGLDDPVVLALPRGGVPVGSLVAARLHVAVEVIVSRKIGAPGHPELAVGAIAEGGEPLFDDAILRRLGLRPEDLGATVAEERRELTRRVQTYRGERPLPPLAGRDVILVDDGLATGSTARAALKALASARPARTVLAVPVGPEDVVADFRQVVDDVAVVLAPRHFGAVSRFYQSFPQLSDGDVRQALTDAGIR